ncbi:MAG: type 1 glutamine amidotransferase [Thermoguttaceae bacterium]
MKPILVFRHTPHCPLGSVASVLDRAHLAYRYVDLFAEVPACLPLADSAGLIVLGGPMSANDVGAHPFLAPELDWIAAAVDAQVPTLGICLGAQLLAKALGQRVYPNRVKEIGWYQIEVLPAAAGDPLLGGCQAVETVFQWHGDTFDLPPRAVHLARSELCPNQAFRYGPCAYGLQFHVEMTPALMAEWFDKPELHPQIGERVDPQAIRAATASQFPAMNSLSGRLLSAFAALCQGRQMRRRTGEQGNR